MRLSKCVSVLYYVLVLLINTNADPISISSMSPLNANEIHTVLSLGYDYEKQLVIKKKRLYESIKAVHGETSDELYALAGVQLDDFQALQSFALGILRMYEQTVTQDTLKPSYDFRSPALKLTFEFQRAVKVSHQRLRSASSFSDKYSEKHRHSNSNIGNSEESEVDPVKEILNDMLKEVSENADQLEEEMQQNMIVFSTDNAKVETVLKLGKDSANENVVNVIVDQDNNEYILMRPSDTTLIIEDLQLIHDFILILVASFLFGGIFTCIGLPAFFGYILAGIIIGPSGYNMIQEFIQIETLAQLGVVLIVFVLGLEFSLEKIKKMWRVALEGAITLLLVTVLFFVLIAYMVGADYKEAIFVGACVSLSSTAVVIKCIRLDQLDHLYGLLVMQDVILGFMLAIIPALSNTGFQVALAVLKTLVSFALFGFVCLAIVKLIPIAVYLFQKTLRTHDILKSHELMLLGTMAICMTMLIISEYLGLGMELGCFAAGVIIRSRKNMFETSLVVIEPVRDMFACLFFAGIGLHVYPTFLASEAMLLLILTAGVIGFKFVATCIILYLFKFDLHKSSKMAIALAQVSEFGFVLASRAKQLSIITREVYYLFLGVTSITLIATPLILKLVNHNAPTPIPDLPHHNVGHREDQGIVSIGIIDNEKTA
ncbi:Sodium/hydrogen exchanger family-domain-containing protein [Sporodiniella umbellata]|nr:Sodium/hydrogen exchanger family-domain-containing protein [Sporodiniella umbellata]